MLASVTRFNLPTNVGFFTVGTALGVLGCCAVRWLKEVPESSATLYLIQLNEDNPKPKAVTLAEFNRQVTTEDLNELRKSVTWGLRSKEIWQGILKESTEVVCLKKDNQLIGFGCFVGNSRMGTIFDVVIHPDHQKKQYGTLLMNELICRIKSQNYATICLFGWEGNKSVVDFYAKFGFKLEPYGMEAWAGDLNQYQRDSLELSS
jgi:ribosomal protein S18 acetylase RimI-like enzyme